MWPWEDPSHFPSLTCDNCGAVVSPEVDVYEKYVDWAPSGSFVRWTCKRCGHTRMSAISADVSEEELEELERQAEEEWQFEQQMEETGEGDDTP